MQIAFYVILALVVLIPLYVIFAYNGLVRSRNLVEEGWSGIDVQLKRRANLIPNLVETVKGYAAHESSVLEEVTKARAAAGAASDLSSKTSAENGFTAAIGHLFAVAESYPDLKADDNFQALQEELSAIEGAIEKARRYYNGAVRRLNTMIEQFPSNLVAKQFRFLRAQYFEIEDPQARAVPDVSFES